MAGRGKFRSIGEFTGSKKILLISDKIISSMAFYGEVKELLKGRIAGEFAGVMPNPECEMVDEAVTLCKSCGADCVIGIGGGSVLDTAKAVAVLSCEEGKTADYMAGKALGRHRQELILVPTTAGTGSEVTNVSVLTDPKINKKLSLVDPILYGDIAIIDPCLTETMPKRVAAASGFDALCHAIEAYWNIRTSPLCEALSMEAVDKIVKNISPACNGDGDAQEEMVIASYIAGISFNQTRTTVCHAISYKLTSDYGIDHGLACAFTLIPFLRYESEDPAVKAALDRMGRYCGFSGSEALIDEIDRLYDAVGLPRHLSDRGVKPEDVDAIVDAGMAVPITKLCKREVTREAMHRIITDLL